MKKDAFLAIVQRGAKSPLNEQELAMFGTIGEAVEKAFQEDSVERGKQIEGITAKLGLVEDGKTISEIVRGLAAQMDEMEKKAKRGFTEAEKSSLKLQLEAKKEDILRARENGKPYEIQFKAKRAAAMMTTANMFTSMTGVRTESHFEDMDITVIQYPKSFVLDVISARQVTRVPSTITKKEQEPVQGDAAVTAEGVTKPLISYQFVQKTYNRKKYAGHIELTEELKMDFEQLLIEVISMFEDQVIRKWHDGVLADIIAYASTYVSTGLDDKIKAPNNYSVIGAGKLHVKAANYDADTICLNPADDAEMYYVQDANGNVQFIPATQLYGGLTPIISNSVPVGKMLIGTTRTIREQHGSFIVRTGTINDQLIDNEETMVGEVFSILTLPTLSKPSWLYLDIATVKAALLKP